MSNGNYNNQYGVSVSTQGQKNMLIAYIFWWFLGTVGAHRFYLGRPGSAVTMIVLLVLGAVTLLLGIGLVLLGILGLWWLIDGYLVYKYVTEANAATNAPALGFNFQVSKNTNQASGGYAQASSLSQYAPSPPTPPQHQRTTVSPSRTTSAEPAQQYAPSSNPNQCANCGTSMMKNMKYCPKCGTER